jgi:hypothetical protein
VVELWANLAFVWVYGCKVAVEGDTFVLVGLSGWS